MKSEMADPEAERSHVWAVIPCWDGRIRRSGWELIAAARDLTDLLGERAEALLMGHRLDKTLSQQVIRRGADRVLLADAPELDGLDTDASLAAFDEVVRHHNPEIVLFPATNWGQEWAARAAERLGTAVLPCCLRLALDRSERLLLGTRRVFGGLEVTCSVAAGRPQMATVEPGAVDPFPANQRGEGEALPLTISFPPPGRRTHGMGGRDAPSGPLRGGAEVVGGLGLGSPEGFELLERAADLLEGRVLASRAAVGRGWAAEERRFGTVRRDSVPELLFTCGVWGAPEELLLATPDTFLVAVHPDRQAPILQIARVAVVGEVQPVIQALIASLEERQT
ncbi:MAG: electron transfer flavoprotein subunit alpha/FixB family protein [Anaerolineae bacterium]